MTIPNSLNPHHFHYLLPSLAAEQHGQRNRLRPFSIGGRGKGGRSTGKHISHFRRISKLFCSIFNTIRSLASQNMGTKIVGSRSQQPCVDSVGKFGIQEFSDNKGQQQPTRRTLNDGLRCHFVNVCYY